MPDSRLDYSTHYTDSVNVVECLDPAYAFSWALFSCALLRGLRTYHSPVTRGVLIGVGLGGLLALAISMLEGL